MYYMYFRYDLADSTLSFDKIHLYKIENGKVTDDDMIDNYQSEKADSENHKSIPLNEEYFPDECFRNYLKEKFDMDKNNILSGDEIGLAERLYINCDQGCKKWRI